MAFEILDDICLNKSTTLSNSDGNSLHIFTDDLQGTDPHNDTTCSRSPFDQLHDDEIAAVPRVKEQQSVRRGGLELKEEMHGGVGLQSG